MGSDKQPPVPTVEEDPPNPSTALLSFNTEDPSSAVSVDSGAGASKASAFLREKPTTTIVFTALLLVSCIALSAATAFAFLFFSSSSDGSPAAPAEGVARPLVKLKMPVVLLVSSDGFRFGYQFKTDTPNIRRLIANGTEAEEGLIPVFPTLTFPNHYSIVTGLYPAYHGIINNYFVDPHTGDYLIRFNMV